MYADFKEVILLLVQHPIMLKPLSKLSDEERHQAYDLLHKLIDFALDEDYTQTDKIQTARLQYNLGELAYHLGKDNDTIIRHYRSALRSLETGGLNLSIDKWMELVSLRTIEM